MINYSSFTCSHCAKFYTTTFKKIKENYIDTNMIYYIYRDVYYDESGFLSSMIARCNNNNETFWKICYDLYETQKTWVRGDVRKNLVNIGNKYMDKQQIDECINNENNRNLLEWYRKNIEKHKINSTPSFIINDKYYSNMDYEEFTSILDQI